MLHLTELSLLSEYYTQSLLLSNCLYLTSTVFSILLCFLMVSIKSVKLLSRRASYLMALKLHSVTAGKGRL